MSLPLDESLRAQWEGAIGYEIHTRNMIWGNYAFHALKNDKEHMDGEERIMRAILAKIVLGQPIRLLETYREMRGIKTR